jgi:hypothetical protein
MSSGEGGRAPMFYIVMMLLRGWTVRGKINISQLHGTLVVDGSPLVGGRRDMMAEDSKSLQPWGKAIWL